MVKNINIKDTLEDLDKIEEELENLLKNVNREDKNNIKQYRDSLDRVHKIRDSIMIKWDAELNEMSKKSNKRTRSGRWHYTGTTTSSQPFASIVEIIKIYYRVKESGLEFIVHYFCSRYFKYPVNKEWVAGLCAYCHRVIQFKNITTLDNAHENMAKMINGLDEDEIKSMIEAANNWRKF